MSTQKTPGSNTPSKPGQQQQDQQKHANPGQHDQKKPQQAPSKKA